MRRKPSWEPTPGQPSAKLRTVVKLEPKFELDVDDSDPAKDRLADIRQRVLLRRQAEEDRVARIAARKRRAAGAAAEASASAASLMASSSLLAPVSSQDEDSQCTLPAGDSQLSSLGYQECQVGFLDYVVHAAEDQARRETHERLRHSECTELAGRLHESWSQLHEGSLGEFSLLQQEVARVEAVCQEHRDQLAYEEREHEAEQAQIREQEAAQAEIRELEAEQANILEQEARQAEIRQEEAEQAKIRQEEAEQAKIREQEAARAKVRQEEAEQAKIRQKEAEQAKIREQEAQQAEIREQASREQEAQQARVTEQEAQRRAVATLQAQKEKLEEMLATEIRMMREAQEALVNKATCEAQEHRRREQEAEQAQIRQAEVLNRAGTDPGAECTEAQGRG